MLFFLHKRRVEMRNMLDKRAFDAAIAMKGSTQQEAARVMGINPATLLRKMKGESDFYRKEIEVFLRFQQCEPEYFFAEFSA